MFSIAFYSNDNETICSIKNIIQDFLIEHRLIAKVSHYQKEEDLVLAPVRYDAYILDIDSIENITILSKTLLEKDAGSRFIFLSTDTSKAYLAFKLHADYFLEKPINETEFNFILDTIKQKIQNDNIIIKTSIGERRVRANNLNYINIVRRCLCYHLKNGTMFDGQTLRTSFEKAIYPLQNSKMFLFLPPSLLINLSEIKEVNNNHIVFESDEILYFPKKSYDVVREAWLHYNKIDN